MLRHGFLGLSTLLPPDLKSLPTLQGMMGGMTPPTDPPTKEDFNFGGAGDIIDTKEAARYLQKKGLIGAQQLIEDQPNTSDAASIRNSQGDWKISAIQKMISRARDLGITDPRVAKENKAALMSTLNPQYRDAINSQDFQNIHSNFWDVFNNSILPEQVKKGKQNSVAKK